MDISPLLADDEYREAVAEAAYLRDRTEQAAVERERETDPGLVYYALAWWDVPDEVKRPYRTAVAETCDNLLVAVAAA